MTRGTVLADAADVADTREKSNTGLLKHESLPKGQGLLLYTQAVHCVGMKFAIDVLFLSKKLKVLKVKPNMGKWRIGVCLTAHSVLELPSGMAAETGTMVGDQLEFERVQ